MEVMKRLSHGTLALLGLVGLASAQDLTRRRSHEARYAPQLLIQFLPGTQTSAQVAWARAKGISSNGGIDELGVRAIEIPHGETRESMLAKLQNEVGKTIAYAEPNPLRYADRTVNDAIQGYHLSKVDAFTAWDSTRGSGITIAVADTGVNTAHADLSANITGGTNLSGVGGANDVTDNEGHGTWVAGTAAAVGNNTIGVAGVAFESRILPIKITDTDTSSDLIIANAIVAAANQGAKVVNVSFSSDLPAPAGCWSSTVISAAQYMRSHGGLVTISAGNGGLDGVGDNKGCANNAELIVVGATDSGDALSSFSNFGAEVDVVAPGSAISTTDSAGAYASVSGTSFSAPLTASVLALIFSVDPTFTPDQVQQILFDSTDDLGAAGYDTVFGWGRANAARAVSLAQERSVLFQTQSLRNVYAYPNPWDTRRTTNRTMTFAVLPDGATVKLFTLSGFWVKTLTANGGNAVWDLRNDAGELVASGLYFYLVDSPTGAQVKGKVAIIK